MKAEPDGLILVSKDSKFGVIDTKINVLTPPLFFEYDRIEIFTDNRLGGYAMCCDDGSYEQTGWGIIDKHGNAKD